MRPLMRRIAFSIAIAALPLVGAVAFAAAATTVSVSLWDKGAEMEMPVGLVYGAAGVDLSMATMGIKATPGTTKAGVVTFKVTNDSKDTVHEMIVMYLADPSQTLPYLDDEKRVDEDKAGDKGEVSELDPGKSGSLTVNLQPGTYLLYCNVPGHYAAGMWTTVTITK